MARWIMQFLAASLMLSLVGCSSADDASQVDKQQSCEEFKEVEQAYAQCKEQMGLE